MAFTENSRVRIFRRKPDKSIEDTGWERVQYDQSPEMYEPADTVFARGANGPTKKWTGVDYIDDTSGGFPLNSNVFYPRTGTAG